MSHGVSASEPPNAPIPPCYPRRAARGQYLRELARLLREQGEALKRIG